MSKLIDKLYKRDTRSASDEHKSSISEFDNSKTNIIKICKLLKVPVNEYRPEETVRFIAHHCEGINRLLYSEITSYIYSLDDSDQTAFTVNMEGLLYYALDEENEIPLHYQKMIMKMYDHSQLAIYQKSNVKGVFVSSIEDTIKDMKQDIKGIEKEYITILGIFASIVLAFVGNYIFSSSVLQNIAKTNIYRLLLTIDFLGFFFATIILVLVRFILSINNKNEAVIRFRYIVEVCAAIAGAILLGWLFQVDRIPEWIVTWLPWGK